MDYGLFIALTRFFGGDFVDVFAKDGVFVYKRLGVKNDLIVAINLGLSSYVIDLDKPYFNLITGECFTKNCQLNSGDYLLLYPENL